MTLYSSYSLCILSIISHTIYSTIHYTIIQFAKLPQDDLDFLLQPENSDLLSELLLYHVAPGIAYADGVQVGDAAVTSQGASILVTRTDGGLVLNDDSSVVTPDILASNGVIHAIDTMLVPPDVEEVTDVTDPTTEEVAQVDEEVTEDAANTTSSTTPTTDIGALNLEQWVAQGEDYSTLLSLLRETGLAESLTREGPLTLVAPINQAFAAIPEKYTEPEWYAHLFDILVYHILPGAYESSDLQAGDLALTALGENVTITSLDPVMINEQSTVIDPDNVLTNGVAHGVDAVLLPPSATFSVVDIVSDSPFFAELLNLITTAGLEDVLSGPGPFTVFAPTNNGTSIICLSRVFQ